MANFFYLENTKVRPFTSLHKIKANLAHWAEFEILRNGAYTLLKQYLRVSKANNSFLVGAFPARHHHSVMTSQSTGNLCCPPTILPQTRPHDVSCLSTNTMTDILQFFHSVYLHISSNNMPDIYKNRCTNSKHKIQRLIIVINVWRMRWKKFLKNVYPKRRSLMFLTEFYYTNIFVVLFKKNFTENMQRTHNLPIGCNKNDSFGRIGTHIYIIGLISLTYNLTLNN